MQIELHLILPNQDNDIRESVRETLEVDGDKKLLPQVMAWIWENLEYGWRYNYHYTN